MRAKVDDFMYVLVAGIVIVIVVLAIFAMIPPGGIGITTTIASFPLGTVGFTGENTITYSYGSFQVGDINRDIIKNLPQVQVSSSYFGGKSEKYEVRVLDAYIPLAKEAIISFYAQDSTPSYGKLIIKWNGLELYNNGADKGGPYLLHIEPQYIRETNNLEVSCDGPGAFFWASTVYILRDFKVTLDYGSMKLLPFTLGSQEIETFKNGVLEFSNPSLTAGTLTMKLNGIQLFSGTPGPSESIKFDLFNAGINPGNNLIVMYTKGDSFSLNNVAVKIFLSTGLTSREKDFTMSAGNFSLFSQGYRGKIEFDVQSITRMGTMDIKLNDKSLNVPAIQKGTNTIYFSEKEAQEGTNTLKFSGTGGWDVGEVRVLMER